MTWLSAPFPRAGSSSKRKKSQAEKSEVEESEVEKIQAEKVLWKVEWKKLGDKKVRLKKNKSEKNQVKESQDEQTQVWINARGAGGAGTARIPNGAPFSAHRFGQEQHPSSHQLPQQPKTDGPRQGQFATSIHLPYILPFDKSFF